MGPELGSLGCSLSVLFFILLPWGANTFRVKRINFVQRILRCTNTCWALLGTHDGVYGYMTDGDQGSSLAILRVETHG